MYKNIMISVLLPALILIGLVSCSDDAASPKTDDKNPPSLVISQPLNNQEFEIGSIIEIVADASDTESGISSVSFNVDGKDILTDDIAPFGLTWDTQDAKSGTHKIKVTAVDKEKLINTKEISIVLKENIGYTEVFTDGLKGANGLVMAENGFLFVSNSGDKTITKIGSDGSKTVFANIECPELNGIIINSDNSFIATCGTMVAKIDAYGNKTLLADGFKKAYSIAKDNIGNIYILDALDNKIIKIAPDGSKSDFISGIAFNYSKDKLLITNMAFDKNYKFLYVSAVVDNKIYRYPISSDGSAGQSQLVASLQGPNFIAIDKEDNVFATTFYDAALVKIQDNKPVTIAKGMFSSPNGIVFGNTNFGANSLFIADKAQNKIFRVFVGTSAIL